MNVQCWPNIDYFRQIEAEHDKETAELQNCWTELRKLVRMLYGCREGEPFPEEEENIPDEEKAEELVHRYLQYKQKKTESIGSTYQGLSTY